MERGDGIEVEVGLNIGKEWIGQTKNNYYDAGSSSISSKRLNLLQLGSNVIK